MVRDIAAFLLVVLSVSSYGCAPMTREWGCTPVPQTASHSLILLSNPSWADFRVVGDSMIYNTPSQLRLARASHIVRIEKDGFEPVLLRINPLSATDGCVMNVSGISPVWYVEPLSEAQYRAIGDTIIVTLKPTVESFIEPVSVPPPVPEIPLMEDPGPKETLRERLMELNFMRKQGKISSREYKALKKKAVREYKQAERSLLFTPDRTG
jgi:hypothetical protein